MSFKAMAWAVKKECKNSSQKLVLLLLANHCNKHTGQCNPSHKLLADECCMSVSSVKTQIKWLSDKGYLSIIRNSHNGVSLPNQYQLNIEDLNHPNAIQKASKHKGSNSDLPRQILAGGGSNSDGGVGQILTGGGSKSGYKPRIEPISITTTTETPKNKGKKESAKEKNKKRGGGDSGIIFSKQIREKELAQAREMLSGINEADSQGIADVLIALIEAGEIRKNPIAVLGGLIRRYHAGTFDSSTGLHIKDKREAKAKNAKQVHKQESVDHKAVMANLEAMRIKQKQTQGHISA